MKFKDFYEGKVIHANFSRKSPYRKNSDIKVPRYNPKTQLVAVDDLSNDKTKAFDHFNVEERGNNIAKIWGYIDNKRINVGTTNSEVANALADAYNRNGFTDKDIRKIPLSYFDK